MATPGGGPNGMALRGDGTAYVANNGGFLWTEIGDFRIPIDRETHTNEPPGFEKGWIEQIDLDHRDVTVLHDSCDGRFLRGPNDLVFDEVGGLWFTDHGKGRHASVDRGGLYYLPPEWRARCRRSPSRCSVRTASASRRTTARSTWPRPTPAGSGPGRWPSPGVVRPDAGSLAIRHGGVCVAATPFSFDSLAVEEDGRIAIGAIGDGIVVVTPDGAEIDVHPIAGDVTTNIAFGGSDRRRAVITLSRTGRLVEAAGRPGLALDVPSPSTLDAYAVFRLELDGVGPEEGHLVGDGVEVVVAPVVDEPQLGDAGDHRAEGEGGDLRVDVGVGGAVLLQAADGPLGPVGEVLLAAHPGLVDVVVVARDLFDDAHDLAVVAVALEVAAVGAADAVELVVALGLGRAVAPSSGGAVSRASCASATSRKICSFESK